jgi:hypothetical protein
MAILEKISELVAEKQQADRAIEARGILQDVRVKIHETAERLQEIADSGSLDTIDSEIKAAIITGWNIAKNAQAGFADDTELSALLDWRP